MSRRQSAKGVLAGWQLPDGRALPRAARPWWPSPAANCPSNPLARHRDLAYLSERGGSDSCDDATADLIMLRMISVCSSLLRRCRQKDEVACLKSSLRLDFLSRRVLRHRREDRWGVCIVWPWPPPRSGR